MSKFLRLSSINQDIQILEQAGDYKSASILHKKFIREAQAAVPYSDPEAAVTNFQTYAQGGTANPQKAAVPYSDPEAAVTNFQTAFQGLGNAMSQPQATSGDTANQMQAMNTMPAESPMYQQAINQIANLLKSRTPMNRTLANQIYESTVVKFQDPKRKKLFAQQFQRLMSTNFPQTGPLK